MMGDRLWDYLFGNPPVHDFVYEQKQVDVGLIKATFTDVDGATYQKTFAGYVSKERSSGMWFEPETEISAQFLFEEFLERSLKCGFYTIDRDQELMLPVGRVKLLKKKSVQRSESDI